MSEYEFTVDWFEGVPFAWDILIEHLHPKKILEIGCFEGRSTCYFIEKISSFENPEIYCVDTWEGGEEHVDFEMPSVEKRFFKNINIANDKTGDKCRIFVSKGRSINILSAMISNGLQSYYDIIYVDGSHQAPDVLADLVLSYQLCKVNGLIICDDYLWAETGNEVHQPKLAIDAFVNIYREKVGLLKVLLNQAYLVRLK